MCLAILRLTRQEFCSSSHAAAVTLVDLPRTHHSSLSIAFAPAEVVRRGAAARNDRSMPPSPVRRRRTRDQKDSSFSSSVSQMDNSPSSMSKQTTGIPAATLLAAGLYILSGVSQPLLMTVAGKVGVTDPRAQLYMLFYYAGPASVGLTLRRRQSQTSVTENAKQVPTAAEDERYWPSLPTILRAASIAVLDVFAQSLNYTGNNLSGPTIFAVIYSSVTIWAAVYSRCLLGRDLNCIQWIGVASVFVGLALTAFHSVSIGRNVFLGACLVVIGSSLHALVYVISEKLMTHGEEKITVRANCAVQGFVALFCFSIWEILYTLPRFEELIAAPVRATGSTWVDVMLVLSSIGLANLVHGFSFFVTLKNFPGGSVSAGVMKGLQAVLVFVFTSLVFCGSPGTGEEMCFDTLKLISLIVVVGGILIYGWETDRRHRQGQDEDLSLASSIHFTSISKNGAKASLYERIPEV